MGCFGLQQIQVHNSCEWKLWHCLLDISSARLRTNVFVRVFCIHTRVCQLLFIEIVVLWIQLHQMNNLHDCTWTKVVINVYFGFGNNTAPVYLCFCAYKGDSAALCESGSCSIFWVEITPAYCLRSIDGCSWNAICVAEREILRKEEREKEHGERSVNKNNELQDVAHPEEISGTPLIEKEANEEQLIITL